MKQLPQLPPSGAHVILATSPHSSTLLGAAIVLGVLLTGACGTQTAGPGMGSSAQTAGTVLPAAATPPAPAQTTSAPTPQNPKKPRPGCPHLDSTLAQLLDDPSPAAVATSRGLNYQDGRVEVSIKLKSEEGDLARRYNLEGERRASGLGILIAHAPLATLCALSADPRVEHVLPPARPGPA